MSQASLSGGYSIDIDTDRSALTSADGTRLAVDWQGNRPAGDVAGYRHVAGYRQGYTVTLTDATGRSLASHEMSSGVGAPRDMPLALHTALTFASADGEAYDSGRIDGSPLGRWASEHDVMITNAMLDIDETHSLSD